MWTKKEAVDGEIDTAAFVLSRIAQTNAEGRQ